jgi:hypothetical protein
MDRRVSIGIFRSRTLLVVLLLHLSPSKNTFKRNLSNHFDQDQVQR